MIPSAGEIWAVTGADAAARSAWCSRIARAEDLERETAILSFAQHADMAQETGWPAARYYEDEGRTVDDFLSYEAVYDINPFEVGARRPETRAHFNSRMKTLLRLLDLGKMRGRLLIALSNGETRRVLLARALAKGPRLLVLDDPAAGLDVRQRTKLCAVLAALADRGLAVLIAARHADELPPGVCKWLRVDARGRVREIPGPQDRKSAKNGPRARTPRDGTARRPAGATGKPVIEIRSLTLAYGARTLFKDFSWSVRRGERWILRGDNGSGKTTLFALITGDSPLAYAADISVFGIPRDIGCELRRIRSRIGMVSPEMQAYLGKPALELIDEALAGRPDLLLLDEPFLNLEPAEARRAARRIAAYLKSHPQVTAVLICHRTDEAPACFDRELDLSPARGKNEDNPVKVT